MIELMIIDDISTQLWFEKQFRSALINKISGNQEDTEK
jgi:hypothetical protein